MSPTDYKNKIASRYVPVEPAQIGLKIIESDYYLCSHKLDGHLGILVIEKNKVQLFDRSGKELSIPAIEKAAKGLKQPCLLAGEICVFKDGKPGANYDVTSALADPKSFDVRFAAFDLISENGEQVAEDLKARFDRLKKITGSGETIFAVEQHHMESRKDIIEFFNNAVKDYEGIVVRASNGVTYKVKPVITLDLVIIGFAEGVGERQEMLRDLMLGCATGKNEFRVVAYCSNGLTEAQRKELFETLSPMAVKSEYLEVSGAKTAFVMVKPELVAEISCLDMIGEAGSGVIRKAVLEYDSKAGYKRTDAASSVSLISPVFLRLRSDKKPSPSDAGLKQIEDALITSDAAAAESGKASRVTARALFTKSGKGGTAVRKFITLKTNKEQSGMYSPFVVVYTDFSAGRKTPMEQEIYLCSTEKEAAGKVDELKKENIKKGWEEFNA